MQWGARLLNYVGFPTSEVLGPEATSEQIKDLIDRYGSVLIKPNFLNIQDKTGNDFLFLLGLRRACFDHACKRAD